MARAWCLIREQPHYRREAFVAGLCAAGYAVASGNPNAIAAEDVVVIWNRYGSAEVVAQRAEAAGARVIVAENGYLGSDAAGRQFYALALGAHNGGGKWPADDGARWRALGIELAPWQEAGGHVLVCPNRPFGQRGFEMPQDWAERAVQRLRTRTTREVRLRAHPGNWQTEPPKVPLAADLEGAHAMVIWASSAGVHALLAGVPVIYEAPWWILARSAGRDWREVDAPPRLDRLKGFQRLACAQWTVEEIASGEPFRQLLAL